MIWVFDAYGTLFDVDGAARRAAEDDPALKELWPALSADWRRKQLEYSWMRCVTGEHVDFWQVTSDALDWAAERHGIQNTGPMLHLYRSLPAYAEVPDTLAALRQRGRTAIFSNGSPQMLTDATESAGIAIHLDALLSVERAGRFKPAADAYRVVTDHFGCAPADILFCSSNGWDIYGAATYGFDTAWINRTGQPVDRLPRRPARVMSDLTGLL